MVKNEFDQIYTGAGGFGHERFHDEDMTAYFVNVPANKLELWMWMESERILHPVFREFYAERDVVFEERRMRTESTPLGKFYEQAEAMFWESAPYAWPVLGWPSDIPAISKAQADEFYGTYYSPQNITLILVGDFKSARRGENWRGNISSGFRAARRIRRMSVTVEVPQLAEKRMYAEADTNPTGGHQLAHGAVWAQGLLSAATCWRNCSPPGRAGSTRAWCWARQWRRTFMPSSNRRNGRGFFTAGGEASGRPHARGGGAGDLWRTRKIEEGRGAG